MDRRLAALFCTNFLPYSQTFVFEELRQHARWDVDVFCWRRLNEARFPCDRVHVAGKLYGATMRSSAFDRAFRDRHYSVVHAHFGPAGTYAMRYAARHSLPLLVTFHGYDVPLLSAPGRFLPQWWLYAALGRRLLGEMTLGLCASSELREMLMALGVAESRLVRHPVGVDLEELKPLPRAATPLRVVMIGRFVEKKGFEYGLRAFARVAKDLPTAELALIGDGARGARLRAMARDLSIADRTTFEGVLASADVVKVLQRSHVLLAPSVVAADGNRESGLVVVKEASASGVVPIGTHHGGIPEIIDDGETGFLVAERDVDALADRLRQVLLDGTLRARLAVAARAKMEREYDARALVAKLEDLYDEAAARKRR